MITTRDGRLDAVIANDLSKMIGGPLLDQVNCIFSSQPGNRVCKEVGAI